MSSIDDLKKISTMHQFKVDEHIFLQGERGDALYLVLRGLVEVYLTSEFDGSHIELARLGDGSIFGEMAILKGNYRSASVRAITDSVLLKISKENFEKFITLEPKYAINLMKTLATRYNETIEKANEKECLNE